MSFSTAVSHLEVSKLSSNKRPRYVRELVRSLKSFEKAIGDRHLTEVSTHDVESWLLSKGSNPGGRATRIARLSTLFEFARRRRWITENPCFFLERVTIDQRPPSILSAEQSERLWAACREHKPRGLAWLALALYAGLRPEEAMSSTWWDIDFAGQRIFVRAECSKVRSHRIVEPPAKAFRMLLDARESGGMLPLQPISKRRAQRRIRTAMGWTEWPKDILRHTCASMWLALIPDAPRIALQLGNSPQILLRHYRSIVLRQDAERFWA